MSSQVFVCPFCPTIAFSSREECIAHAKAFHNVDREPQQSNSPVYFVCHLCSMEFLSKDCLLDHMQAVHVNQNVNTAIAPNGQIDTKPPAKQVNKNTFVSDSIQQLKAFGSTFAIDYMMYDAEKYKDYNKIRNLATNAIGPQAKEKLHSVSALVPSEFFFSKKKYHLALMPKDTRAKLPDETFETVSKYHAKKMLTKYSRLPKSSVKDQIDAYRNTIKKLRTAFGFAIREIWTSDLRGLLKTELTKLNLLTKYEPSVNLGLDAIKRAARKDLEFSGIVLQLAKSELYSKNQLSGSLSIVDLENKLLKYCNIRYIENIANDKTTQIAIYIRDEVDTMRGAFCKIHTDNLKNNISTNPSEENRCTL